jgi:hypothetical protein
LRYKSIGAPYPCNCAAVLETPSAAVTATIVTTPIVAVATAASRAAVPKKPSGASRFAT